MRTLKSIILVLVCLSWCATMSAGRPMISAKADSATVLMGSKVPLHVELVKDRSDKGEIPAIRQIMAPGSIITALNDTVEFALAAKPDTTDVGSGRIQINYSLIVQVFDSGYYRIPVMPYINGKDTVAPKDIFLKVLPVKATASDKISPMTSVLPPQGSSIFDFLPDWVVRWWWILLLIIAAAAVVFWLYRRYRTTGSILPPKPETPPHIVALSRLKALKSRHLWEDGREKEYYTLLTDILRIYLFKRFGIKAMEMTSRDIMEVLTDNPELRLSKPMMRQILDMADFVKFAKVRPLSDDNVRAYDNAVKFVEETAPKPEENAEEGTSTDSSVKGAGSQKGSQKGYKTENKTGSQKGGGR